MGLRRGERIMLAAFAGALLPPSERLPGARADAGADSGQAGIEVVEPLSSLLGRVAPRARLAVRVAIWLFELTTFPRRFSRLPIDRRTAHLEHIDRSRGGLRRELYLLLKTLATMAYARDARVQDAVGVSAGCERAGEPEPPPAPPLDATAMRPQASHESCDVVVVGSGAGGAAAARLLAEAGLSVIVVEEGQYHDASDYSTDPFEALQMLYRDGGLTFCEGRPAIPMPIGRCVGGTTSSRAGATTTESAGRRSWKENSTRSRATCA